MGEGETLYGICFKEYGTLSRLFGKPAASTAWRMRTDPGGTEADPAVKGVILPRNNLRKNNLRKNLM